MKKLMRILRIASRFILLTIALLAMPLTALDFLVWLGLLTQVERWGLPLPYLFAVTGTIGWLALFRLVSLMNCPLKKVPRWVILGVVAGIVSAIAQATALGEIGAMAAFPIMVSIALLLDCSLAVSGNSWRCKPCKTS